MVLTRHRNSKEDKRICKINNRYSRELFPLDTWDTKYRANYLAKLINIQQNKCNLCSEKLKNVETSIVDHIVQKHYCKIYGKIHIDKIQNCQVLCPSCNHIKTYKVDTKINKLIKDNDSKTHTYDGLRSYTINLLRKIYREKEEDLAKVKETTNQYSDSDSEDESDEESDKKSVQKVFSKLLQQSSNNDFDEVEHDELPDFEKPLVTTREVSKGNSHVKTRSKSGSLPKKVDIKTPNIIITKSKQTNSIEENTTKKRKIDYDDSLLLSSLQRETNRVEIDDLNNEIMIPNKIQKDETSQIISKKKDGKFISLIFRNCNFNNCSISL